ncbi:hypothetical protein KDA_27430 [Dictyobacter alpinus]|uniref:UmuC domain-containing protein n=1 Tax=Dictyobacter alpinus TaxID=2014873 RepID=A0A402B7F4_9CHLR|nr:hypothetical protein [Dictyobacter alpinus]GCE27259.1 hypothetical protein KDA_27430 [Dictyobacter alpinus]
MTNEQHLYQTAEESQLDEAARAAERARLRQGVMHVRIDHFYCTLEEQLDPSLRGQSFIVGTGTGRPNEPGRVIDVSPAAARMGLVVGMPLRRAHRMAPRTRFLPASYNHYQPILKQLKDRYRAYSRIIETLPVSDAFIDLRGCELPFTSPAALAERLCAEIAELGLNAMIGVANGKSTSELAALMSRRDGRDGVLYIPRGREASFVQTLPLSLLPKLRATGMGTITSTPETSERNSNNEGETKGEQQVDAVAVAEMVAHLHDFGITSFAQIAELSEEGLVRRLGQLGSWLYRVAIGEDDSLVIPDAPPLSQNARVHFHHQADADETCSALRKLADHLSERLQEQRLKGQSIALILWPNRLPRETRNLQPRDDNGEATTTIADETIGGQMLLDRHTDAADIIAHHGLMLFAHYHRSGMRYLQVQLRIGDMITTAPTSYYPPPARARGRLTRKL